LPATVQATTKNFKKLQETSTNKSAVITRISGQLHASRNVKSVDGNGSGVRISSPPLTNNLASYHRGDEC
ncbi:MAG TPA: hypothetical protein PLG60_08415, partial [Acidimicrobiales bacterium]|nr:hypothetical protein [Acidimicrobiales bacterium]